MDFSFSGIKTGVLNYVNSEKQAGREINVPDIAASFQQAVLEVIVNKTVDAALKMNKDKIVMAGGVSANSRLREMMKTECEKHGLALYHPSPILCTDNAAMIGGLAWHYLRGTDPHAETATFGINARLEPTLGLLPFAPLASRG